MWTCSTQKKHCKKICWTLCALSCALAYAIVWYCNLCVRVYSNV